MVQKGSRVAAIYDVHGNLPALEAVLADLESVSPDLTVVGGDVVAGPMPAEVLDRLAALGNSTCFVRGNADRKPWQPTTTDRALRLSTRQKTLRSAPLCTPPPRSTAHTETL